MWEQHRVELNTTGRGFFELTGRIQALLSRSSIDLGTCHLFLRHTSASLCITENVDHAVRDDLERYMQRSSPDGDALFRHVQEGPDDMPAHARSLLVGYELTVPVNKGQLLLGTWQGLYLWEHRLSPHSRELIVTFSGLRRKALR